MEVIMRRVVSATEARVHFGELMRRVVEDDETVVVQRGGQPQVVVLSIAEYRRLDADKNDRWWRQLEELHAKIRAAGGGRLVPPTEDVIREMREERDAQLLENLR
jgi:prevent-host-death family protein